MVDEDMAVGFGHVMVIVEDDDGNWHYYSYGSGRSIISTLFLSSLGISVKASFTSVDLGDSNGYNLSSFEGVKSFLTDNGAPGTASGMDEVYYLQGDFSESYEYADSLVADANSSTIPKYHLTRHNCMTLSVDILSKSISTLNDIQVDAINSIKSARGLRAAPNRNLKLMNNIGEMLK